MRSVETAGALLRGGKELVVFDCGGDAMRLALSGLDARGSAPTALSDAAAGGGGGKMGQSSRGPAIVPPEEAVLHYPEAYWLIANFLDRAKESAYLEGLGIPPERIVNYTPWERRPGCRYLESYLQIRDASQMLYFCCGGFERQSSPCAAAGGPGRLREALREMEALRAETLKTAGRGSGCGGCAYFREDVYPKRRRVELVNYGDSIRCNFRCSYCTVPQMRPERAGHIDFPDAFAVLKEQGLLSEDVHVQFCAGEIGADPDRARMFQAAAAAGATMSVLTNGSIYMEEAAAALSRGDAVLNISVDAGSREVFKMVKGADAWERVGENLERYAAARKSNVCLKYIFLPGVNDGRAELDGFLRLCGRAAGYVQISHNFRDASAVGETTRRAFRYLADGLDERGLRYHLSAGSERVLA